MPYSEPSDVAELLNTTFSSTSTPTSDQVADFIAQADDWINAFSMHDWLPHTNITEYYDGQAVGPRAGMILLKQLPVTSVTQVQWYDGSVWQTAAQGKPLDVSPAQAYEVYLSQGKIQFYYLCLDGMNVFKVTYNAGYTSIPFFVQELSACLAALKVIAFLSGPAMSGYFLGDLRVQYPEGGKYGNQWKMLKERANELKYKCRARIPSTSIG